MLWACAHAGVDSKGNMPTHLHTAMKKDEAASREGGRILAANNVARNRPVGIMPHNVTSHMSMSHVTHVHVSRRTYEATTSPEIGPWVSCPTTSRHIYQ